MSSTLNERLAGINRDVPQTADLLTFLDGIIEDAILARFKLVAAIGQAEGSWGIVASSDPREEDGSDSTAPLIVTADDGTYTSVNVYPGAIVCEAGLIAEVTANLAVALAATAEGDQNVVYIEYLNEETDLRPVRSRTYAVAAKRTTKAASEMVKVLSLEDYNDIDATTMRRVVPLAVVTVQKDTDGALQAVVDMTTAILSTNRPWFSPVDMYHRNQIGSGTPTVNNPHGMTANDFQVAGDLSLYQALIGRGLVIAPSASLAGVPGTACTETIPRTRWEYDADGSITGTVGHYYCTLLGYPLALGACELQDANAGTESASMLPVERVEKKNIIFVDGAIQPDIVVPGPGADELRFTILGQWLGNETQITISVVEGAVQSVVWDATSSTLTVTYVDGVSTTNALLVAIQLAIVAYGLTAEILANGTGTATWVSGTGNGTYTALTDDATWLLRYTSVAALEPPADFENADSLTFGTPAGDEALIADGLAFNSLISPTLSLETLGPVPRRVWVAYDDSLGLIHVPQVLVPYNKLDDFTDDEYTSEVILIGAGKIRVWLLGATAGPSLEVVLTVDGTDSDGNAISSTLTFDGTWVDNPGGSTFEQPAQALVTPETFAGSGITVSIVSRVSDGPFSAVVVEVVPDFINEPTNADNALLVASFLWDGFRPLDMYDEREMVPSLKKAGVSRWERVGAALLASHALWPANEHQAVIVAGDDSENMLQSDQILTRRFGLRPYKDTDDPTQPSIARNGLDSWYVTGARRASTDMRFIQVMLLGNDRWPGGASPTPYVQLRWTTASQPDTWSDWTDMNVDDYVRSRVTDGRAVSFHLYLPDDVVGFDPTDSMLGFQLRIMGRWWSHLTVGSDENLHEATADALISALTSLFALQHWDTGFFAGSHKAMAIIPDVDTTVRPRLDIYAEPGDKTDLTDYAIRMWGWETASSASPSNLFWVSAGGDWYFFGQHKGDMWIDGNLVVDGLIETSNRITAPEFWFTAIHDMRRVIPLNEFYPGIRIGNVADTSYVTYTQLSDRNKLLLVPADIHNVGYDGHPALWAIDTNWYGKIELSPYIRHLVTISKIVIVVRCLISPATLSFRIRGRSMTGGPFTGAMPELWFDSLAVPVATGFIRFELPVDIIPSLNNLNNLEIYGDVSGVVITRVEVYSESQEVHELLGE